jgi:hypothetical protein
VTRLSPEVTLYRPAEYQHEVRDAASPHRILGWVTTLRPKLDDGERYRFAELVSLAKVSRHPPCNEPVEDTRVELQVQVFVDTTKFIDTFRCFIAREADLPRLRRVACFVENKA